MSGAHRLGRRRAAVAVAGIAMALLIVYIALWVALPASFRTGNDFAPAYVAGRLVLQGHGDAIYDQARIVLMERSAAPPGYQIDLPYISPPAAALVAAPLSALSFPVAESVWSLAQLLATIAAAGLVVVAIDWPADLPAVVRVAAGSAAVAAPTVGALLLFGESDGIFTLGVAAGFVFHVRGHALAAGVAFGLAAGLAKPHLLIGVLAFLLFSGALRVVATSLATACAVNLCAVAVIGSGTGVGFASAVLHSGIDHAPSGLVGVAGLLASWLGNGTPVRVVGLIVASILFAVCARLGAVSRRAPHLTPELFAAALAVGLLASPHLLVPDVVVLVPAFIWLYARVLEDDEGGRWYNRLEPLLWVAWIWLGVATVMDAANGSVGFPGRLTPEGLALFALTAWLAAARTGRLAAVAESGTSTNAAEPAP